MLSGSPQSFDGPPDQRVELPLDADTALVVVEHAAELWGATWSRLGTGGRIELPVQAGVRHGIVRGRLWTEPARRGTAVVFRVESSDYALKSGAVTILGVGGLGAMTLIFWPLYPPLLGIAPLGMLFSVLAWLLIASRLQNAGVEDFLNLVATGGEERPPDPAATESGDR